MPQSNVDFRPGYFEDLAAVGIADNSVDDDLQLRNQSVTEKQRIFAEIFRVLKPGGEFYFSDVFAGRRFPRNYTKIQ